MDLFPASGCEVGNTAGPFGAAGWIGSAVFHVGLSSFWSLSTWLLAIVGSVVVLLLWGLVTGRRG